MAQSELFTEQFSANEARFFDIFIDESMYFHFKCE